MSRYSDLDIEERSKRVRADYLPLMLQAAIGYTLPEATGSTSVEQAARLFRRAAGDDLTVELHGWWSRPDERAGWLLWPTDPRESDTWPMAHGVPAHAVVG